VLVAERYASFLSSFFAASDLATLLQWRTCKPSGCDSSKPMTVFLENDKRSRLSLDRSFPLLCLIVEN